MATIQDTIDSTMTQLGDLGLAVDHAPLDGSILIVGLTGRAALHLEFTADPTDETAPGTVKIIYRDYTVAGDLFCEERLHDVDATIPGAIIETTKRYWELEASVTDVAPPWAS